METSQCYPMSIQHGDRTQKSNTVADNTVLQQW